MLRARPRGFCSRHYVVTDAQGATVAELVVSHWREGGQLHHGGKTYRMEREHLMSGPWFLKDGDDVRFEAHKPSMLRNRFLTNVKGASLELAPKSWTMRSMILVGPDWRGLGEIRRVSWWSRNIDVDLSDAVPPLAQLFFLFQALLVWKRQAAAASS